MVNQLLKDQIFEKAQLMDLTLDGLPAKLVGRLLIFPIITNDISSVTFSWPAVDRILNNGGHFNR